MFRVASLPFIGLEPEWNMGRQGETLGEISPKVCASRPCFLQWVWEATSRRSPRPDGKQWRQKSNVGRDKGGRWGAR